MHWFAPKYSLRCSLHRTFEQQPTPTQKKHNRSGERKDEDRAKSMPFVSLKFRRRRYSVHCRPAVVAENAPTEANLRRAREHLAAVKERIVPLLMTPKR
jgi:hypothetical protein